MTQHGGAASAGACPPMPPGDAGESQVLRTCTRTCTNAFDCERLEHARRPPGQMTADQFCLARGSHASAQAAALLLAPFQVGDEVLRYVGSRSEEHTSELQSLMRISYAVFCLKKKKQKHTTTHKQTKNSRR